MTPNLLAALESVCASLEELMDIEYAKFAESVMGHRPAAPNFYDNLHDVGNLRDALALAERLHGQRPL